MENIANMEQRRGGANIEQREAGLRGRRVGGQILVVSV